MARADSRKELLVALFSNQPLVYIRTHEEQRAISMILECVNKKGERTGSKPATYSYCSVTTRKLDRKSPGIYGVQEIDSLGEVDEIYSVADAVNGFLTTSGSGVLILLDVNDELTDNYKAVRSLKEACFKIDSGGAYANKNIIILGPELKIDPTIEKQIHVMKMELPSREIIERKLSATIAGHPTLNAREDLTTESSMYGLSSALTGLTDMEVTSVIARTIAEHSNLDVNHFVKQKKAQVEKNGILEFYDSSALKLDSVGGVSELKEWLTMRRSIFSPSAEAFGISKPKGVLLLGPPGTGKSLLAKVIASSWGMPLLILDMGRVMGSLVGESEGNMRSALETAEAISPSVLMLDEIEKNFGGTSNDGGTSQRVFGKFLTWMQEKTSPVFVVATANDITNLPPEMLRKGRFDEIFFVDLPVPEERVEILRIHIRKSGRDPNPYRMNRIVELTDGFSGSEIESVVNDALIMAYSFGSDLKEEHLEAAALGTVPLSISMKEKLQFVRAWAKDRAKYASTLQRNRATGAINFGDAEGTTPILSLD